MAATQCREPLSIAVSSAHEHLHEQRLTTCASPSPWALRFVAAVGLHADQACDTSEYTDWKASHPSALESFSVIEAATSAGARLAVFSDYDGTLSEIVEQPDRAFMTEAARAALSAVAARHPVAIISGRSRQKIHDFVGLEGAWYAGSHGLDVSGPAGDFLAAPWAAEVMRTLAEDLRSRLAGIPGSSVELNTFCCSAHYRCCPDRREEVASAVAAAAAPYGDRVKICTGRKVLEVKPAVEWDKGRALLFILDSLGLRAAPPAAPPTLCLYFGDDTSDEDAFRALRESGLGLGVLVSSRPKATAAHFSLRNPSEVTALLERLAALPAAAAAPTGTA